MALLGDAAVAMWWDMAPELMEEFEHWHSHEHFPERMGIPGFMRGSRWSSAVDQTGIFVLYELQNYETLTSDGYRDRLNAPTPWSVQMMPHHRNMVRSQCRVACTHGAGVGGSVLTLRVSPAEDRAADLKAHLSALLHDLPGRPGISTAHLLITQTPDADATTEQRIRGADAAADWIVVVGGYDRKALAELCANDLAPGVLERAGALAGAASAIYHLSLAVTPADLLVRAVDGQPAGPFSGADAQPASGATGAGSVADSSSNPEGQP